MLKPNTQPKKPDSQPEPCKSPYGTLLKQNIFPVNYQPNGRPFSARPNFFSHSRDYQSSHGTCEKERILPASPR